MSILRPLVVAATLSAAGQASVWAQGAARDTTQSPDSVPAPQKKGLFGKVKGLAGNKGVTSVAKTAAKAAACNMVPGGPLAAGAVEAAAAKRAGKAAAEAAGAAAAADAAARTTCMPGGLGTGVAGAAAQAGADAAAGAAMSAQMRKAGAATPTGAAGFGDTGGVPSEGQIAKCLGLTKEEFAVLMNPTGGEPRQPTEAEMKRQEKLAKKVDTQRYQRCIMAAMSRPE